MAEERKEQDEGSGDSPEKLSGIMKEIANEPDGDKVSVKEIMESIDNRSYGPLLLIPALFTLTPLGALPGMPIIVGFLLILIAAQMMVISSRPWIPKFLLDRELPKEKVQSARDKAMPYLKWVDQRITRRLTFLTDGPAVYIIALMVIAMGLSMYPLGLIPFAVMIPSLAVVSFGIGMAVGDGIMITLGFVISVGVIAMIPIVF